MTFVLFVGRKHFLGKDVLTNGVRVALVARVQADDRVVLGFCDVMAVCELGHFLHNVI